LDIFGHFKNVHFWIPQDNLFMRTEKSRNNMFGIAAMKMVRKTKVGFLDF
jgi:hypothetical protein